MILVVFYTGEINMNLILLNLALAKKHIEKYQKSEESILKIKW